MQYLVDTHVCLWAVGDRKRLSKKVSAVLEDRNYKVFVSQISLLELAVKIQTGKLIESNISLSEFIETIYSVGFEFLPIKNEHAIAYSTFNFFPEHRDPFDRYLAVTAYYEHMTFVTADKMFKLYTDKIDILW